MPRQFLSSLVLLAPLLGGMEFFVSVSGDDAAPGTRAHPFATVARAQTAVRAHLAAAPSAVTVTIGPGLHFLTAPLTFTAADSGRAGHPVVYRGEGRATLSGGRRIVGFAQRGDLWTAVVPDVAAGRWSFRQLTVNGRRRPRARTPNEGEYFRVAGPLAGDAARQRRGFHFGPGDVRDWQRVEEAVFFVSGSWYNTIHHLERLDLPARAVHFTNAAGRPFNWYERNLRYYVENVREALDRPGEWHLDRQTGELSYFPLPGESIETCEVLAPVLAQTLVHFQGEPKATGYAEHIGLEDLEFRHADAHLPRDLFDGRQGATVQSAAILLNGARDCWIRGCTVANVGEHGIWLRDDCHRNTVQRCHLFDLGGGGVYVGSNWRWGDDTPAWRGYRTAADIPFTTEHNTVDNCFVHDGGHLFTGAVGVWVGQASHTRVTRNHISDLPYSGISVGWDWSGKPSTAHHNLIEGNHVHHVGLGRMNDLAGIYTLGVSPGTVVRRNLVHDVMAYQSPAAYCLGAGIYLDQSSAEILVEENVCHSLSNAGIFLHNGANNQLRNNVLSFFSPGGKRHDWGMVFCSRRGHGDQGNVATGNILFGSSPRMAKVQQTGDETRQAYESARIDGNLYFPSGGEEPVFTGSATDTPLLGWEEWREMGHDGNSLVADPRFVNAAGHDYRLRADSPALGLGIRSIDLSAVGLYGPPEWTGLPECFPPRPAEAARPFRVSNPLNLFEDFEAMAVGQVPEAVQFTDPARGATVAVTDAAAAAGRHSLRFVDAPGLLQPYHPNRVWRNLSFSAGTVRVGFDAMNSAEQPATFLLELRDWSGQRHLPGPSLTFLPSGGVQAGPGLLLPGELGRWYRVEIEFVLGTDTAKSYRLRFAPMGEEAKAVTVPFVETGFDTLTWLGFVAMDADRTAAFHVDNLRVEMF